MNLKKLIGPIKVVIILLVIVLGILAVYNIYSFGYRLLLGTKYAYLGGYATHQVNEDNMAPDYKKGDMVIQTAGVPLGTAPTNLLKIETL